VRASTWVGYATVRILVALVRLPPRNVALWLGEGFGRLARILRLRRTVVRRNLEHVGYGPEERQRIEHRLYRQIGRYTIDALRQSPVPFEFDNDSRDSLTCYPPGSSGTLLLFSHLGNWELLVNCLDKHFSPAMVVAKPLHNPLVSEWMAKVRSTRAPGAVFVPPENALRQSMRALRAGGAVAFAIDQYGGSSGISSQFLDRPARTVRSTAGLEQRTRCRVIGAYALLDEEGVYHIVVKPVPPAPSKSAIPELLARHNDLVSAWIRQYPEHWFGWFHRRFKDVVQYA
jgi:KDO2-lipid IV(A) lauroyltransferase